MLDAGWKNKGRRGGVRRPWLHESVAKGRTNGARLFGGRLHLRRADEAGGGRSGGVLDRLPHRFHAHFSGIDYGPKGERRHLNTTPKFFRPLAEGLVGRKVEVTLINESPRPYQDAAMMKRVLEKLMAG
jgi:hypothetical protein